jgi:hypothetical protein
MQSIRVMQELWQSTKLITVMTYTWPTCHLAKQQPLQKRKLLTIGNLAKYTPVHKLHVAQVPYMYHHTAKLCST